MQTPKVRYQALGPLMAGEGSRAFLGLEISDVSPARPVVMVWVPGDTARDTERRAQILRETQRAVTLEHPNITRVYGLASLDEGLARVVEFSDGESLRRVLEVAHRLPAGFAARVVVDAATGLHFAHIAGNDDGSALVHGDIRPETLMVTYSGNTKVAGYGALSVAPKETDGKRVKRRRLYCAPEQIIGGRNAISVQTDVYLMGLILFEALTGRIPFEDEENFDQAVLEKPIVFTGFPEIPPAFIPVLVRATAKRAAERFPSALAFRDELDKAMGQLPPTHRLPTHQEFSGYLQAFFPEEDPARQARRQTIDAGLSDHARQQWEKKSGDSGSFHPTTSVTPGSTSSPGQPVPAPPRDIATRRPTPLPVMAVRKKANLTPLWFAGLVAVMAAGVYVGTQLNKQPPEPVTRPRRPTLEPVITPTETGVTPPATAQAVTADAGAAAQAPTPTPTPPPPVAVNKPPPEPPRSAAPSQLELNVTPAVNVSLKGKSLGRTPLTVSLPPGTVQLKLTDPANGINVTRAVTVNRGGVTRHFMELGKGQLSVRVPDGATINLDGKLVGHEAVRDLSIYEGNHHLVVTMSGAKWQQSFLLNKDQTLEYEVNTEPKP